MSKPTNLPFAISPGSAPVALGHLNLTHGTYFRPGELAASVGNKIRLDGGEIVPVWSGPVATPPAGLAPLTGAETDTLIAMIECGPLEDGDVPSKAGRDSLIERGLAMRVQAIDYWRVAATHAGIEAYKAMFGPAETLREAQANRKAAHS